MADIKFSEFPKANQSKDSDEIAILQDGVNKMIASPVLESKIINKTVSRVIDQGGASLNVINLKGVVPTYADLALITPTPQLNDAYQVLSDGLVYVYTENGFQADGDGFKVQPEPNGVVEEDNPNAVSGGEVFLNLPEYIQNVNLFYENEVQIDKYIHNDGTLRTLSGWKCSGFIPVEEGNYYLSGNKVRYGLAYFDENQENGRYSPMNTGLVQPQDGEAFVVFNLESPVSGGYSDIKFEVGDTPTPLGKKVIKKSSVEGLEAIEANFEFISIQEEISTTNLFNPNTAVLGLLNENSGSISTSGIASQYDTSDFIPSEPSTLYTAMNINGTHLLRKIVFYNSERVYISGINGFVGSFTTPANTAFTRVSVANETFASASYPITGYGVFIGANPEWEPYEKVSVKLPFSQQTEKKANDEVATIGDIETLISGGSSINYQYNSSGILTVKYDEGTIVGQLKSDRGYTGNNMFNFSTSQMKGVNVGSGDDVAPMHILGSTMGANHGFGHYHATISGHGFTNMDIGTEFEKDGVSFFILRIVDENTVAFISQNNGTAGDPSFVVLTTGTLTRDSNTYVITNVSYANLFPSIGELYKKLILNGRNELIDVSSGTASKIEAFENYVIYDPTSVLNNIIARAGQPQDPSMIGEHIVLVENIYRFVKEPACLVFANVQFLKEVAFADIMVSQAVIIGSNNGTTQYYVPNSNPLNGSVDLRKPTAIAWSSSIPTTYIINANQPDPNNPPNRVIQYRGNVGFMLCYILTRGQGKNIADFTNRTFEIRNNTGKIYPHPVEGSKVGTTTTTDSIYSVAMARVYTDLTKTRVGNRLSIFSFTVDDEKHVYIDYSGSMIDKINLEDFSLNGKSIEVLESKNTTLKNNIYNQGFVVNADYVEGETCYLVLMIK